MIFDFICEPCETKVYSATSSNLKDLSRMGRQHTTNHSIYVEYEAYRQGWMFSCSCFKHNVNVHQFVGDMIIHCAAINARFPIAIKRQKAVDATPVCMGCNNEIDPETCHCGDRIADHSAYGDHAPVPMGCTCGYGREPEIKTMSIDNVTLLQIEKGILIVEGRYFNDIGKAASKPYYFKMMETDYHRGALCIAGRNGDGGYALIEVGDDISDQFEPQPGINYVWAVPIDTAKLDQLMKTDKDARKTIRLGAAIAEAKAGLGALADSVALLPSAPTPTKE